jgi:hypothetical protein
LNDNYNFPLSTFDTIETHGGGGSFLYSGTGLVRNTEEYMAVDPNKYYRQIAWAQDGDTGGANYTAVNRQYLGVMIYDIDLNQIYGRHYRIYPGAVDTTLAAQLTNGDSTLSLTASTGWYNSTTAAFRQFSWWPYTNLKGYTYPNYTYSRNISGSYSSNNSLGTWDSGGISGTTVTLRVPWGGPTLPIGTPIRNSLDPGSSDSYITMNNVAVPNTWTRYEGYIGGLDTAGAGTVTLFPYGAAFIRTSIRVNLHGVADNFRLSDMYFGTGSARNLESASATVPGVVATTDQTFAGVKTFSNVPNLPTSPPASSSAAGTVGGITWDSNYVYTCVATNTWKRAAIATW